MTLSDFRRITDELLSAYIDDEVTEQERILVETAIAQDQEIAWRLDSLRQTVMLLQDLPELALPRSFTLNFEQLRLPQANEQLADVGVAEQQPVALPTAPPRPRPAPQAEPGFWDQVQQGWRRFWQGGNPMLRNAAAVSFALMLLLAGGGPLLNRAVTQQSTGNMAAAPMAAPAAAPAAEMVALAPTATESSGSESAQDVQTAKAPAAEQSARILQAQPAPASEETPTEASVASSVGNSADSVVAESGPAAAGEMAEGENAQDAYAESTAESITEPEAETAVAEAASDTAQDIPEEEAQVAAAMAAPAAPASEESAELPLVENPIPGGPRSQGGGGGGGMGSGGSGQEIAPGMGGGETGLVPPQAFAFDANPTPLPAEEAVSASVAAVPAESAPAEAVANMVATPAVDAPAPQVVAAAAASEPVETEVVPEASDSARSAAPATETVEETVAQATAESVPEATIVVMEEAADQAAAEATVAPTPEAVALVAPGPITSSDVVANVSLEGAVPNTSTSGTLPVVWIAQGSAILLTLMLSSLWWRSRRRV